MSPWNRPSGLGAVLSALSLTFVVGCGDTAEPTQSVPPSVSVRATADAPIQLAACGNTASPLTSAMIGPEGGVLSAGPVVAFVPPQAVHRPTHFTLQSLAGSTLRLRLYARGHERFAFARPIAVMIGYSHCTRQEFLRGQVSVWHVDDETSALLELMPTVHDRRNATVGFMTTHLSTYAVAN
jgi:hypothetical protein